MRKAKKETKELVITDDTPSVLNAEVFNKLRLKNGAKGLAVGGSYINFIQLNDADILSLLAQFPEIESQLEEIQ